MLVPVRTVINKRDLYLKMKIRLSNNLIIIILYMYILNKLLWDKMVPFVFTTLFFGVSILFFAKFIHNNSHSKLTIRLLVIYVFFSIYVMANAFVQDTNIQMIRSFYEYILYVVVFFSMAYLLRKCDYLMISKYVAYSGVVVTLLSWYEYFSKSYLISQHDYSRSILYGGAYAFRACVFSRSVLAHGVILGVYAIFFFYLYICEKKSIYFIATVISYVSILTTSSRGPLVSTGVALVIMFMINARQSGRKSIKNYGAILLLVVAIILIVIFLTSSFMTTNEMINYFLVRMRNIINWKGDGGNVGRINRWNDAISWFKMNPLFGIGPSKTGSWGTGSIGVTESGVLKRLCELGIVGFILHYMFVGLIVIKAIRSYKFLNNANQRIFICNLGLLVAVLINDCILQSTEEIMVSFIMWTALAGLYIVSWRTDLK